LAGAAREGLLALAVGTGMRVLAALLATDLSDLDLVALMVDGVNVAGRCCVVALGIISDGTKVPLGLAEGATENTVSV
jgi:hypothetical protein